MATANTASIIAAWPEEGCSLDEAFKRAPAWADFVNPPPELIAFYRPTTGRATWVADPEEAALSSAKLWAYGESEKWLRKLLETDVLALQCRDAKDDQPTIIQPSMIRHLRFNVIEGLAHGLGRTFYDLRVFAAEKLKVAPTSSVATGLDTFRTGAAGKPTAADFIRSEVKRRIGAREVVPRRGDLEAYSRVMWDWYEKERHKFNPPGPEVKSPGSVENMIRPVWNCALRGARN